MSSPRRVGIVPCSSSEPCRLGQYSPRIWCTAGLTRSLALLRREHLDPSLPTPPSNSSKVRKGAVFPRGHFTPAADAYTHFSLPVRRYPDLIVHRLLKPALAPSPGGGGAGASRDCRGMFATEAGRRAHRAAVISSHCRFVPPWSNTRGKPKDCSRPMPRATEDSTDRSPRPVVPPAIRALARRFLGCRSKRALPPTRPHPRRAAATTSDACASPVLRLLDRRHEWPRVRQSHAPRAK